MSGQEVFAGATDVPSRDQPSSPLHRGSRPVHTPSPKALSTNR